MSNWESKLKGNPIPWLLSSNPWTKYATLTNLLDISASAAEAREAKKELLLHPLITEQIQDANNWLAKAAGRNSDPTLSYFKLRMLADFGLDKSDAGIEQILNQAVLHRKDGMFAVRGQIPQKQVKGYARPDPDADIWNISPCNSPIITYALLKMGLQSDEVLEAVKALQEKWTTPEGWFCHFFFVESQYKKLHAGCPMAGVMALDVFSLLPEMKESEYAKNAFAPLLFHRDYGKSLYYFGRSKKFWTMKYPFVWYNALYLADVLTRFDFLQGHDLVHDLVEWILSSQDEDGRFKASSIFLPYQDWDFGKKKVPSPWITYTCCKILKQWYR